MKVHVLAETHQLLTTKLQQQNQTDPSIQQDLEKIEKELKQYAGMDDVDQIKAMMVNDDLIYPHTIDY